MLFKTHLAFGLLVGLIILPYANPSSKFMFLFVVIAASIMPDIDQPNSKISNQIPILPKLLSIFVKHRGIFHSIFFAILLSGLFWYFINHSYGVAFIVGYMSHLLIDGFTKSGINFLHPFGKLHLSGFIETGTTAEWIIFLIILLGIVINFWKLIHL